MEIKQRKKNVQNDCRLICSIFEKNVQRSTQDHLSKNRRSGRISSQGDLKRRQIIFLKDYDSKERVYQKVVQVYEYDEFQKIQNKGHQFIDQKFLPNEISLYGQMKGFRKWKIMKWQRLSVKIPDGKIIVDQPSPTNIKQGQMGNAYFLAAISALAQNPNRIKDLFLQYGRKFQGHYSLKLLSKGKWIRVDIDDYIPFEKNKVAFSTSEENQLWLILLEKAWAKICGSYKRSQLGSVEEALHDLTGAPVKVFSHQYGPRIKDYEWKYFLKALQLKYAVVCSFKMDFSSDTEDITFYQPMPVQGCSYTLLDAFQINCQGTLVKILKLRNPWGQKGISKKWNSDDPSWQKVQQKQKKRINFKKNDDGIVYISFDEFWKEFMWIAIAEINDKASYLSCSGKDTKLQGCYFSITINKDGIYSLQVDKPSKKTFQIQKRGSYSYPHASIDIIYLQNGKGTLLEGFSSNSRVTHEKYKLKPGTYIAKVKIDYDPEMEQDFDVTLAIYADYPCSISLASKEEVKLFKEVHIQKNQSNNLLKSNILSTNQRQIIQIHQLNPYSQLAAFQKEGKTFVDQRFPPNNKSLCGQWKWETSQKNQDDKNWQQTRKQIKWQKISEAMVIPKLYVNQPNPTDIIQGSIGDCYFLAGLAALAQRPERIYRLFLKQGNNKQNYYSVRMLFKGKWVKIDLDDYLPFIGKKPAFSKSVDKQLWVVLLEKAWAKLYGSYKRIQAGFAEQPLHDLTGAPIVILQRPENNSQKQQGWQYLLKASKLEYSMVCASNIGSDSDKSKTGIVLGHAFTLLNATYLNYKGKKIKLLQLRNPWGQGEFQRDWSDKDKKWMQIPKDEKDRVGFKQARDDGIFFISLDDFWREFQFITIAQIDDNASYVNKSYKDQNKKGCYFKVDIHKTGNYSLQVDKTPQRYFEYKDWQQFEYPKASIGLAQLKAGKVNKIKTFESYQRLTNKTFKLSQGVYIVKVKVDFIDKWEADYQTNLAVYGDHPCVISLASNEEADKYQGRNANWSGKEQGPGSNFSFLSSEGSISKDLNIWKLQS